MLKGGDEFFIREIAGMSPGEKVFDSEPEREQEQQQKGQGHGAGLAEAPADYAPTATGHVTDHAEGHATQGNAHPEKIGKEIGAPGMLGIGHKADDPKPDADQAKEQSDGADEASCGRHAVPD